MSAAAIATTERREMLGEWEANWLKTEIGCKVRDYAKSRDCGWTVFGSSTRRSRKALSFDIAFLKKDRFPDGAPFSRWPSVAPDLAIEVVDAEDSASEIDAWIAACRREGIELAWLIDPKTRSVRVHRRDGSARRLEAGETLDGETILPGFRQRVGDLIPANRDGAQFGGVAEGAIAIEEFESRLGRKRFELVNGHLVEKRPMGSKASFAKSRLHRFLSNHCLQHPGGEPVCETEFQLAPSPSRNVRVPDVAFIRQEKLPITLPDKGFVQIVPDLIAEIISPNDLATEVDEKLALYLQVGVTLIWLINPQTRSAIVFHADRTGFRLEEPQELDGETVLPGFRCALAALFA